MMGLNTIVDGIAAIFAFFAVVIAATGGVVGIVFGALWLAGRPSRHARQLRQRVASSVGAPGGPQRIEGYVVTLEPFVIDTDDGEVELPPPWLLPRGRELGLVREMPPRTFFRGERVEVFAVRPDGARALGAAPELGAIFVWRLRGRRPPYLRRSATPQGERPMGIERRR